MAGGGGTTKEEWMGVTTDDIFGDAAGAQPATPGSYGEAPSGHRLPAGTRLGGVRLQVADLARSVAFYESVLGLRVTARDATSAVMGAHGDDAPLVELRHRRGAARSGRRRLGLFHFAILLPDRASLGRFVRHLGDVGVRAGAGDHLVSEALYLQDPDDLGIEVYADRPRESWRRVGRELMMSTDPLDVQALVRLAGNTPWRGMPAGTVMGHVHLHVGDLARASAFYCDAVGFDRIVWSYPGALFLSAGGYHHHLGTNVWAGPGAEPAHEDEPRLLEWTLRLPAAADIEALSASLTRAGHPSERDGTSLLTRDPWGTALRVVATG